MDERSIVQLPAVPENPSYSRMISISIKDDARGLERTDCAEAEARGAHGTRGLLLIAVA
jgi:hypothetical protein